MNSAVKPSLNRSEDKTYWRSLWVFNLYRIIITCIFIGSYYFSTTHNARPNYNSSLFLDTALGYWVASLITVVFTWLKRPRFNHQVTLQVISDIGFIIVLMFAAGGIESGFGLLLVIAIAAASLISQGRFALFYAAIATIGLLLEQSYQFISWNEHLDDYTQAAMLSLSCFATAWLAHSFAKRTFLSETLASQRGVDLENLGQINQLITQEMPDGVLVVDGNFKLRHHNSQADALLGLHLQNWHGSALNECAPELVSLMQNWINNGVSVNPSTVKLTSTEKELKLRFMPIGSNPEKGAVIFVEDWSQMQAQAQQNKLAALGQLTANMAHEIRNPLSAISHANQLLQEEELASPSSQRLLQIIATNVQRMDQMVKDILELNRRDRLRQESIELTDFISDFHHQFCQIEKIPTGGFILNLEDAPTHVFFDRRHLHQILWNLCCNGWRHGRQATSSLTLSIQSSPLSYFTTIKIIDDGAGIASEAIPHIFEPFFTTVSTGTGLGLYIARELCEANGATIKYTALESGSLFTIQLKKVRT